jgi:ADP-ribose pyrophosphatase
LIREKEKLQHMAKKEKSAEPVELKKTKKLKKSPKKKGSEKKSKHEPTGNEKLISSKVVFQGPLFRVLHDTKSKKDPWIVMERQYRHAATQYLWELPAGKLDPGEEALAGAQRELEEETGYRAKKWEPLVEYYGSPGFLGESMKVFLAQGLVAGDAHPEEDEEIEFRLVKMSEIVKMIEKGAIKDGKTLCSVLLYARRRQKKRKT